MRNAVQQSWGTGMVFLPVSLPPARAVALPAIDSRVAGAAGRNHASYPSHLAGHRLRVACSGLFGVCRVRNALRHLNHDGYLTQFNTWRYHDHTGTIAAYIDNLPNGGGQLRLGLRKSDGTQFTNTTTWTAFGSKEFTLPGGSNQISPINFAINGRMDPCGIFCDDDFGGTLYY
jgi:hypothetical protein